MKKILLIAAVFFLFTSFTNQDLTWIAIGDSITYFNDHVSETGNRITKGYMTRVTDSLSNIHYINKGYNGWTSGDVAASIDSLGLTKADVYSVFLGTNDWWHGRPIGVMADYRNNTGNSTVYGSFRIIINKLHSLNKDAKIILVTLLQRGDWVYVYNNIYNAYGSYKKKDGQSLSQIANVIINIAKEEHTDLIDLYAKSGITVSNAVTYKRLRDPQTGMYRNYTYPAYASIPFNPKTDAYPYPPDAINMTFDGLHPSDKGYTIIANMLIDIFEKYLAPVS